MIELYAFNGFDPVGEISSYVNLEIEINANTYSKLILDVYASPENANVLAEGNILVDKKDFETENPFVKGYQVQHIEYTENGESTLRAVAFSLNFWLSYRSIYPQQYFRGNVIDAVHSYINTNAINPTDTNRVIPDLFIGFADESNVVSDYIKTGGDLLEYCMAILEPFNGTIDILIDFTNRRYLTNIRLGVDRGYNALNAGINPVFFSEDYENIISQEYIYSAIDYKSVSIVAGEGEGDQRTYVETSQLSGLQRRELFVDARDLQTKANTDSGEVELTPEEYTNALISRGNEQLLDNTIVNSFDAVVNNNQFAFNRDYFIGDMVAVNNLNLGITADFKISQVKIVSNKSGVTVSPVFGPALPNIFK